ncbi:hypothetical protein XENTR_v10015403 [Xenopus tropicalis]|nr:hypothetical protein XENTR_v10015403 [Xenopus tropicalis]
MGAMQCPCSYVCVCARFGSISITVGANMPRCHYNCQCKCSQIWDLVYNWVLLCLGMGGQGVGVDINVGAIMPGYRSRYKSGCQYAWVWGDKVWE